MTFEHIPPRAAFNDAPVSVRSFQASARGLRGGVPYGKGLGRPSLCERCNSWTGATYANPWFVRWTTQALVHAERAVPGAQLLLPFTIDALAVTKQIATMAIAMAEPKSIVLPHFVRLRRFILTPWQRGPIPGFRILTYIHIGEPAFEWIFAPVKITGGPYPIVFCQVGIRPLGYIIVAETPGGMAWAAAKGLCDITGLAAARYKTLATYHLALPSLRGHFPFAGTDTRHQ